MKFNKWTVGLAAGGVVSLASVVQADEAQKPMSQLQTAVSSTVLSGFVDTSIIWKPGTGDANLPGRAFDGVGKLDGFNLNLVDVTLEKPLSEDQWAAGYRVDLLFGPDAVGYNVSVGNNGILNNNSDFGIRQAYVSLRVPAGNGIDFKVGTFTEILGYEDLFSYANPNYSRSFGWQLEPTQQTGLLASYKASDAVSISAGIANTWNAGVIDGLAGNSQDTTSLYAGGSLKTPVEGLSVGAAFDYRFGGPSAATVAYAGGNSWAYAIAGYASFQANEKWKFNIRGDYTEGTDGTFYDRGAAGKNLQNRLGALTITSDYALWANVVSRAELRWDHSTSGDKPYGGTVPGVPNQRNA